MYRYYNPNPAGLLVEDCTIRALTKALNLSWVEVYDEIALEGRRQFDMPSANNVWEKVLRNNGYLREVVPNTCPDCYTIRDFAIDNPFGLYVVGTGSHVVTIVNGDYYDTWDSGDRVPIYYYRKERTR